MDLYKMTTLHAEAINRVARVVWLHVEENQMGCGRVVLPNGALFNAGITGRVLGDEPEEQLAHFLAMRRAAWADYQGEEKRDCLWSVPGLWQFDREVATLVYDKWEARDKTYRAAFLVSDIEAVLNGRKIPHLPDFDGIAQGRKGERERGRFNQLLRDAREGKMKVRQL